LDGQIDYLNALKNQDLSDYGNTDVDDGSSDSGGDKDEKDLEEIAERYHEITREVEALERATNRLGEQADRSYGQKRLDLMDEQQKALKEQYERQKDLLEMQKAFLALDL
jgi:archaellum component FlaC